MHLQRRFAIAALGGLGSGAALSFLLDPSSGRRRRAMLRDGTARTLRRATGGARDLGHDASNRTKGLFARLRGRFRRGLVMDEVLEERVRAAIGRECSHAGALDVSASNGGVTLTGPILEREHRRVVRAASRVRGVRSVNDRLEPHVRPGGIPGLQEPRHPPSPSSTLTCGQLMKRAVHTVGATSSVQEAVAVMTLRNVGFLPVCDETNRVIGTLTDRDVVIRAIAAGLKPIECQVSSVMTRGAVACHPDDELALAEQLMARHQVSRLVITDGDGYLQGVLSLSDIAEHDAPRRAARTLRGIAAREVERPS
jgi:CBS domain-containing protein